MHNIVNKRALVIYAQYSTNIHIFSTGEHFQIEKEINNIIMSQLGVFSSSQGPLFSSYPFFSSARLVAAVGLALPSCCSAR